MKNIVLFFILILQPYLSTAQSEWAPIGAIWHINEIWYFDPPDNPLHDYYTIQSTGDTMIGGYTGRKVGPHITVQEGDRVYLWREDTLHLMFDYSLTDGDSVQFSLLGCTGAMHLAWFVVDKVDTIHVDTIALKRFHTSATGVLFPWDYHEYTYIEKVGHPEVAILDYFTCAFTTDHVPAWMRCYRDDTIFYRSEMFELLAPGAPCDVLSSTQPLSSVTIGLFPNPASSQVILTLPTDMSDLDLEVSLVSPSGHVCRRHSYRHPSLTLDISGLPAGLYHVWVRGDGRWLGTTKLVVE